MITPVQEDGSGVDAFAATLSAGPALRAIVVGLLSDVSMESARRLAETAYMQIVDTFGLNDTRKPDEQIDAVLRAQPARYHYPGWWNGWRRVALDPENPGIGWIGLLPDAGGETPARAFRRQPEPDQFGRESLQKLTPPLHFSPNIRPRSIPEFCRLLLVNWRRFLQTYASGKCRGWMSLRHGQAGTCCQPLTRRDASFVF